MEAQGNTTYRPVLVAAANAQFVTSTVLLLLAYLFGATVRLFANDLAEVASRRYLKIMRRGSTAMASERFPYPYIAERIRDNINPRITEFLAAENPSFAVEGNKDFYNYCKSYVRTHSPARADACEQIEGYVRFLAGAYCGATCVLVSCSVLAAVFVAAGRVSASIPLVAVAIAMLLVIMGILARFRQQHGREVMHTWIAYYDAKVEQKSPAPPEAH
jgi:cytochrome c biogenesis protein CcdA